MEPIAHKNDQTFYIPLNDDETINFIASFVLVLVLNVYQYSYPNDHIILIAIPCSGESSLEFFHRGKIRKEIVFFKQILIIYSRLWLINLLACFDLPVISLFQVLGFIIQALLIISVALIMSLWNRMAKKEMARVNVRKPIMLSYDNPAEIKEQEAESLASPAIIQTMSNHQMNHKVQSETMSFNAPTNENIIKLRECFEKFSSSKKLHKHPRTRLNASGVREIIPIVPETDITLSKQQLSDLFKEASLPLHPQTISHIYSQIIAKKGKGIGFNDLMRIMNLSNSSMQSYSDYQQTFRLYDRKNRGYFDYEDYKLICDGIAKRLTQTQIQQAFNGIDLEQTGRVTLQNFVVIMRGRD